MAKKNQSGFFRNGDVRRKITGEIPERVAADSACQNAIKNLEKQSANIEHNKALGRMIVSMMKGDTEFFKHFTDNDSFQEADDGYSVWFDLSGVGVSAG